jgi:E3 ubiquitin-protein ligase SIAH1
VFVRQCESGHVLCCYCRGGHVEVCGRADIHCDGMDAFVSAAKVPCAYARFGCDSYVVYHQAAQHKRDCHHAPCLCPEPGCGFLGVPPALIDHFASTHSRTIIAVRYGRPWNLSLPLAQRWHVVVGQDDQSVFLVTLGELGAAATAVSTVCVRADGAAAAAGAPQFWCKLSVEHPGGDKDKVVLMASSVGSSALSNGAPVPGQGMFLAVPRELMSGDMLAISVRIDQVHRVDAATAAAKTVPTPPARTARRVH